MADPFRRSSEHGVHRSCEIIAHQAVMANPTPGMQGGSCAQSIHNRPFAGPLPPPTFGRSFILESDSKLSI